MEGFNLDVILSADTLDRLQHPLRQQPTNARAQRELESLCTGIGRNQTNVFEAFVDERTQMLVLDLKVADAASSIAAHEGGEGHAAVSSVCAGQGNSFSSSLIGSLASSSDSSW